MLTVKLYWDQLLQEPINFLPVNEQLEVQVERNIVSHHDQGHRLITCGPWTLLCKFREPTSWISKKDIFVLFFFVFLGILRLEEKLISLKVIAITWIVLIQTIER